MTGSDVVATLLVLVTLACGVLAAACLTFRGRAQLDRERVAELKAAIDDERAQTRQLVQVLHEQHAAEIAQLHTQYGRGFERILVGVSLGGVAPGTPATAEPPKLNAEERARREVIEQTVNRGVAVLRERYAARGISRTDEELRDEAEALAISAGVVGMVG